MKLTEIYSDNNYCFITNGASPEFEVGASVNNATAWRAFNDSYLGWTGNTVGADWISIDLKTPIKIWKFTIFPAAGATEEESSNTAPGTFSLYGSNNGTYYDLIEKFSSQTDYLYGHGKDYILSLPTNQAYRYYKIVLYTNANGASDDKRIGQLLLYQYVYSSELTPSIRISKKIPDTGVNLAYAASPEIQIDDIGVSNVFSIANQGNNWIENIFSKAESRSTSVLSALGTYNLPDEYIVDGSETVTCPAARSGSHEYLIKDTDYSINAQAGTITILVNSFIDIGVRDTSSILITYQYNPLDILRDYSLHLPSRDILLTNEYAIKKIITEVNPPPLFYYYDLSYPIAKPTDLVVYPAHKSSLIESDFIYQKSSTITPTYAMPISPVVSFRDENGPINFDYKIKLTKNGSLYNVRVYCTFDPQELYYVCYTDSSKTYRKEIITLTPVFNRISLSDLESGNFPAGSNNFSVEEYNGELKLYARTSTTALDNASRLPTEIKLQVTGDVSLEYNEEEPAEVKIGVILIGSWAETKGLDQLADRTKNLLPAHYSIVNPFPISGESETKSKWEMSLSLPDDYIMQYDIIIIAGASSGTADISPYNAVLTRFINQGGTLIIDNEQQYPYPVLNLGFGNTNPLLEYSFDATELGVRVGSMTYDIPTNYTNIYYGLVDAEKIGVLKTAFRYIQVTDIATPFDLGYKNIVSVSVVNEAGQTLTEGTDYTIDYANGLFLLLNDGYLNLIVDGTIKFHPSATLNITTTGFSTIIASTVSAADKKPLLALKTFSSGGRIYLSNLGLITSISSSREDGEEDKFFVNLLLTISQRKNVSTPWIKYNIYHASELFESEKVKYKYLDSLYNGSLVSPRRIADKVSTLLEQYTGLKDTTGTYEVKISEKDSHGNWSSPIVGSSPNCISNYGVTTLTKDDAIDIFSLTPKATSPIIVEDGTQVAIGFPTIQTSLTITPILYRYSVAEGSFVAESNISHRTRYNFNISEASGEVEIAKIVSLLNGLPAGTDWANTDYVYYKISLDSDEDTAGSYTFDREGGITLFVKDKYTGEYIYSNDGSIIVPHEKLYSTRRIGELTYFVHKDISIFAKAEYHRLYITDSEFAIKIEDGKAPALAMPLNLNENEAWFPEVGNLNLSEIDEERNYIYYYDTIEYYDQPWIAGYPFRKTTNELAKYEDRNTLSVQNKPLYILVDELVEETMTELSFGVFKASHGNWSLNQEFENYHPYVVYVDNVPQPIEYLYVDFKEGTVIFLTGHEPGIGTIVTVKYAFSNIKVTRKIYQTSQRKKDRLTNLTDQYYVIPNISNKEILSIPAIQIQQVVGDQLETINPSFYNINYKNGLIKFNAPILGTFFIVYAYNGVEQLTIADINKNSGRIKVSSPLHFNDTIYIDYISYCYSYQYTGYYEGRNFIKLDLNPTFGHECTYAYNAYNITLPEHLRLNRIYENRNTFDLLGEELYIYMLPRKVYDKSSSSYVNKGYMNGTTNNSTIRHTWNSNEFDILKAGYPEIKLLGTIKISNNKTLYDTNVLDTRSRGGGLKKEITTDMIKEKSPMALDFWDISPYAGIKYNTNGIVVIKLPKSILNLFTADQIDEICQNHLGAGIKKIIKYYDTLSPNIHIVLDTFIPVTYLGGQLPLGAWPSYLTLDEFIAVEARDSTDITVSIFGEILEDDE